MIEHRVSRSTAKILKDKKFQERTTLGYKGQSDTLIGLGFYNNELDNTYSAPTHGLVIQWLEEIFNIHIKIHYDYSTYKATVCHPDKGEYKIGEEEIISDPYNVREQAINKALELI